MSSIEEIPYGASNVNFDGELFPTAKYGNRQVYIEANYFGSVGVIKLYGTKDPMDNSLLSNEDVDINTKEFDPIALLVFEKPGDVNALIDHLYWIKAKMLCDR